MATSSFLSQKILNFGWSKIVRNHLSGQDIIKKANMELLERIIDSGNEEALIAIANAGTQVLTQVNSVPFVIRAMKSSMSSTIFRCVKPGFTASTPYWVTQTKLYNNGFEALKWFIQHDKMNRVDLLNQLGVNAMLTEFDYFVNLFSPHTVEEKAIIESERIAKSRRSIQLESAKSTSEAALPNEDIKSTSQSAPHSEGIKQKTESVAVDSCSADGNQMDLEITKAMTIAVKNWDVDCLIALTDTKRGDPQEAINMMIKIIEGRSMYTEDDIIDALTSHPRFDIKSNFGLFSVATSNKWPAMIKKLYQLAK